MKTQTTTKGQKKSTSPYREILNKFGKLLQEMEVSNYDDESEALEQVSEFHKEHLNDVVLRAKIFNGLHAYLKRLERRATRKPLTVQRMKSLNDELKTLSTMLKL